MAIFFIERAILIFANAIIEPFFSRIEQKNALSGYFYKRHPVDYKIFIFLGQPLASWIFGSLTFIFILGVFFFGPENLTSHQLRLLAFINALLAALFGYFLIGNIAIEGKSEKEKIGKITIQAGGSFAMFVLVLGWWSIDFQALHGTLNVEPIQSVTPDYSPPPDYIQSDEHEQKQSNKEIGDVPPSSKKEDHVGVFLPLALGGILLGIYLWALKGGKDLNIKLKHFFMTVSVAILSGLFGYYTIGRIESIFPVTTEQLSIIIQPASGFVLFILVLYWWNSNRAPYRKRIESLNLKLKVLSERNDVIQEEIIKSQPLVEAVQEANNQLSEEERAEFEARIAELKQTERDAKEKYNRELERRLKTQLPYAGVLLREAKYKEAESVYRSLLEAHPNNSSILNGLFIALHTQAQYQEAEPFMRRALKIDEDSYGPNHPDVAITLNNLAQLLQNTNRFDEAEPLMRRALKIDGDSFGLDHPNVARDLNNLASLLQDTNRLDEAESLMRRALEIFEVSYGSDHPNVAINLNNLAQLLQATNRLDQAEPLMRRALKIDEASFGSNHPKVAIRLNNLVSCNIYNFGYNRFSLIRAS